MAADGYGLGSIEVGGRSIPIVKGVTGARIVELSAVFPCAFGEQYRKHQSSWACIACSEPLDRGVNDGAVFITGGVAIVHPHDVALAQEDSGWMSAWPVCPVCIDDVPPDWRTVV